jgi:hypothetical protein
VYLQQVPEWTPNVQFYSDHEYLRVKHAMACDVRGTLAVPVFEASSRSCLAVIELVMKAEKVQYAPEIDIICRALQVRIVEFNILIALTPGRYSFVPVVTCAKN